MLTTPTNINDTTPADDLILGDETCGGARSRRVAQPGPQRVTVEITAKPKVIIAQSQGRKLLD